MKRNITVNAVPTIKVEVSQAPVCMTDWVKSNGLALAAAAATTLVTGVIGGLCSKMFRPKVKQVNTAQAEEIIDAAASMIQDDE